MKQFNSVWHYLFIIAMSLVLVPSQLKALSEDEIKYLTNAEMMRHYQRIIPGIEHHDMQYTPPFNEVCSYHVYGFTPLSYEYSQIVGNTFRLMRLDFNVFLTFRVKVEDETVKIRHDYAEIDVFTSPYIQPQDNQTSIHTVICGSFGDDGEIYHSPVE